LRKQESTRRHGWQIPLDCRPDATAVLQKVRHEAKTADFAGFIDESVQRYCKHLGSSPTNPAPSFRSAEPSATASSSSCAMTTARFALRKIERSQLDSCWREVCQHLIDAVHNILKRRSPSSD
jgi:hypothetical protein